MPGEGVDVRRIKLFLSVAAEVSPTQVVGKDEYYIWLH